MPQVSRLLLRTAVSVLSLLILLTILPAKAQKRTEVGLELVLLVDVSASVSTEEYRLQLLGLSTAFQSASVLQAIKESGGIAVCVVQWAQKSLQHRSVDWMHLKDETSARRFALAIAKMGRPKPSGQTAIGDALKVAQRELETNSFDGLRRVIDLSGDGKSNDGVYLPDPRRDILAQGITINGLAILNEMPDLGEYFQKKLIGGPNSFVLTAVDYTDFSRAIREKLDREIQPQPVANLRGQYSVQTAMSEP